MSKIADAIQRLESYNIKLSVDSIMDDFTGHDIKEYIIYLQNENKRKDETIKDLITENVTLEVKAGIK